MCTKTSKTTIRSAFGVCARLRSGALALGGACLVAAAGAQDTGLSAGEWQFVQHPTHCAHLVGGRQYIESPTKSYGVALEAALAGASAQADIKAVFARLRQACPKMLAQRSAQPRTAAAVD